MRRMGRLAAAALLILMAAPARGQEQTLQAADHSLPPLEKIVAGMVAQGNWQDQMVRAFRAIRRFEASNARFKLRAGLEVRTTFRFPDSYESVVLKQEGSRVIRERVFNKILEEEKTAQPAKEKAAYDILPDNYLFRVLDVENCGDRQCFRLALSPKRKNKFLLEGFVWVDTEDYGIAKVQGSPSKRVSFWTLRTEVTRSYKRFGSVWMTERIDSVSDLLVAGRSTLSIAYSYQSIEADHAGAVLSPESQ